MPAGPGSTWAAPCNGVAAGRGVPPLSKRDSEHQEQLRECLNIQRDHVNVLSAHTASFTGTTACVKSVPASFNKTQEAFQRREAVTCFVFFGELFFIFFEALNVAGYCSWWKLNKVCVVMPSASWEHGPVVTHQGASYLLWTFERQYSNVFKKQLAYIRYSQNQSIALNFKYIDAFQYLPAAFVYAIWKQLACVQVEKVDSSVFYCDWYYCDWPTLIPSLNFHLLKLFNRIICLMQNRCYVF